MIYVHIPFCRTFCTYCGFYSERPCSSRDEAYASFADAVIAEIRERSDELQSDTRTLYLGGGTPSVLPLPVLSRIIGALGEYVDIAGLEEFTVEVNPDDIVSQGRDYVRGLLDLGVNRVSMGVQSFDDRFLRWMNRRHDAAAAEEAYALLRGSGVRNVSLDLIFGISHMDMEVWDHSLSRILSLPEGLPDHISAYQLSIEPDSALDKLVQAGKYREASDEQCRAQYEHLCSRLHDAGYHHYEISNFALPGREAIHNSAYWTGVPYVGLGPGAHSFRIEGGEQFRSWNLPDLDAYVAAAASGEFRKVRGGEVLTREQVVEEEIMLGLRTDRGIAAEEFSRLGRDAAVRSLLGQGLLEEMPGGRIRIPESQLFISDSIIVALI